MLCVGTCEDTKQAVWASVVARKQGSRIGQLQSWFYNSALEIVPEEDLKIVWRDDLRYTNFAGPIKRQKRAQREIMHRIVTEEIRQQNESIGQAQRIPSDYSDAKMTAIESTVQQERVTERATETPNPSRIEAAVTQRPNTGVPKANPRKRTRIESYEGDVDSSDILRRPTNRSIHPSHSGSATEKRRNGLAASG